MKKIFIGALMMILVFNLVGCGGGDSSNEPPKITLEQFNQVQTGMTVDEVFTILGGPGEVTVESGKPGEQMHIVTYQYWGKGVTGSNASFTFMEGKMDIKAQALLK